MDETRSSSDTEEHDSDRASRPSSLRTSRVHTSNQVLMHTSSDSACHPPGRFTSDASVHIRTPVSSDNYSQVTPNIDFTPQFRGCAPKFSYSSRDSGVRSSDDSWRKEASGGSRDWRKEPSSTGGYRRREQSTYTSANRRKGADSGDWRKEATSTTTSSTSGNWRKRPNTEDHRRKEGPPAHKLNTNCRDNWKSTSSNWKKETNTNPHGKSPWKKSNKLSLQDSSTDTGSEFSLSTPSSYSHVKGPERQPKRTPRAHTGAKRDNSWIVHRFSTTELHKLAAYHPFELVTSMHNSLKRLVKTLNQNLLAQELDCVLKILLKLSKTFESPNGPQACLIIAEILSDRCPKFVLQLRLYCVSNFHTMSGCTCDLNKRMVMIQNHKTVECRISCIQQFFEKVLITMPSMAWKVLPVSEFVNHIKASNITGNPDILGAVKSLEQLYKETRELFTKPVIATKPAYPQWDNSEYRSMSIFPAQEELCVSKQPAKLRPSIVQGSYEDWMHYYDIQFRLLREDFTAPLRRGIFGYTQGLKGKDLRDVRIYRKVHILEPVTTRHGVSFEVFFDQSRLKCNWAHSKRLLYGSLVCLSCDTFKHIIFATVSNRSEENLNKGIITLEFQQTIPLEHCTQGTEFVMIESSAYFEASRYVMASLQTAETNTMPFTRYLIANECTSVALPHYLKKENIVYDLSSTACTSNILKDNSIGESSDLTTLRENLKLDILDDESWQLQETQLDSSQLKALKMALTQEIALIQGPPGTGKTYIGIKIVQTLLANKHQWDDNGQLNSPILVMCYTNHALDQFLEGILDATPYQKRRNMKIIRIGGRSKSDKLRPFNIANKRGTVLLPREILHRKRENEDQFHEQKMKLNNHDFLQYRSINEQNQWLTLDCLRDIMSRNHHYQLLDLAETSEEEGRELDIWLGLWKKAEDTSQEAVDHKEDETSDSIPQLTSPNLSLLNERASSTGAQKDESPNNPGQIPPGTEHPVTPATENKNSSEDDDTDQIEKVKESNADGGSMTTHQPNTDFVGVGTLANDNRILDDESTEQEPKQGKGILPAKIHKGNVALNTTEGYEQSKIQGLLQPCLSEEEVESIDDLRDIDIPTRWKLYNYWRKQSISHIQEQCEEGIANFTEVCARLKENEKASDRFVLETADILGMTTTGVAKYQHILHMVKPRIVIVEEAAEVLESHIVSALNAGTQHLILIGDHKQLKPKPNEHYLAKHCNMEVSLFERLIRNQLPFACLNIQHRMRPEIANLVRPHIYTDLQDHHTVQVYEHMKGVQKDLFLIQHQHPETHDEHLLSYSNAYEADYICALFNYLLKQGYNTKQITVLVTYTGQLLQLRSLLPRGTYDGVIVQTVDNYQGEENDIVLLSLVRSNEDGDVGFLREDNRVCVSVSRAKKGFYCIGNFTMLAEKSHLWRTLLKDLAKNGFVGEALPLGCANHPTKVFAARSPNDFQTMAPNGGCDLNCQFRLQCGHVCPLKCHIYDPEHTKTKCKKPCSKRCPEGHHCSKLCCVPCGDCQVKVSKTLPKCGHQSQLFCFEDPSLVRCQKPCKNRCSEGLHDCPLKCYKPCQPCLVLVPKVISKCQHTQMVPCSDSPSSFSCQAMCLNLCENGHPCPKKCSEPCGPCEVVMEKTMPKCSHIVPLPCSVPPHHSNCPLPCEKELPCGHKCQSKCSEKCTLLCKITVSKQLICGHSLEVACHNTDNNYMHCCQQPCERLLLCNHPCKNLCSEPCTHKCMYTVNKIWPCGHKLKRKCYQTKNPELYPCNHKCGKELPCGHTCDNVCGELCVTNCRVDVQKTHPCGHTYKAPCGYSAWISSCDVKVKITLPCGHICVSHCGGTIPICNVQVSKSLSCGHTQKMLCCESPTGFHCKAICKLELACGHRCSGVCGNCREKRFHSPCKYGFDLQRFCGHKNSVQCVGMDDVHPGKQKTHLVHCIHRKCTHDCKSVCKPCEEPCPWDCPHHSCSKLCHEVCDRPPCNEKCTKTLKCGHQCVGVCGDPCITVCPLCRVKDFNKLLMKSKLYEQQKIYIQLSCKHMFTLESMDKYIHDQALPNAIVAPLCCPTCKHPLTHNFRYGNACKQHLADMHTLQETIDTRAIEHIDQERATKLEFRYIMALEEFIDDRTHPYYMKLNRTVSGLANTLMEAQVRLTQENVKSEEHFLHYLLVNTIEIVSKLDEYPEPKLDIVENYLNLLLKLLKKPQVSIQIIHDLIGELCRISLLQQVAMVTTVSTLENEQPTKQATMVVSRVEEHLEKLQRNTSKRITVSQYTKHSSSLKEAYEENSGMLYPVNTEKLAQGLQESIPPTLKGVWRKCPQGHFYCVPLTLKGKKVTSSATHCQHCIL